jgi:hypothetical protein
MPRAQLRVRSAACGTRRLAPLVVSGGDSAGGSEAGSGGIAIFLDNVDASDTDSERRLSWALDNTYV